VCASAMVFSLVVVVVVVVLVVVNSWFWVIHKD